MCGVWSNRAYLGADIKKIVALGYILFFGTSRLDSRQSAYTNCSYH